MCISPTVRVFGQLFTKKNDMHFDIQIMVENVYSLDSDLFNWFKGFQCVYYLLFWSKTLVHKGSEKSGTLREVTKGV